MDPPSHMLFRPPFDEPPPVPRDSKKDLLLSSPPPPQQQQQQLPSIVAGHQKLQQEFGPLPPSYPPPSYSPARDSPAVVDVVAFPDAPKTELPLIRLPGSRTRNDVGHSTLLPSLSTLAGPTTTAAAAAAASSSSSRPPEPAYSPPPPPLPPAATVNHWPSLNPLTAFYTPSHLETAESQSPGRMDVDTASNGAISAASPDRAYDGRASSVSLDDPDVRMAAEALGDLKADFISSPTNRSTPLPMSPGASPFHPSHPAASEPLFSLLTTSHPLLAKTIEGTTSAYNTSKNFSPRFKISAEYVEGYLSPIASTVGNVGRATGVEGGVRWFLGGRRQPSLGDLEADVGSHKRRKIDGMDFSKETLDALARVGADSPATVGAAAQWQQQQQQRLASPYDFSRDDRRLSMSTVDTLPAYDDQRSPAYTEAVEKQGQPQSGQVTPRPGSANQAWQSRLIMSTSGLSIAMSEESLRSLKYCLRWLRWANDHIGKIISALKMALEQFERPHRSDDDASRPGTARPGDRPVLDADAQMTSGASEQDRGELAAKITALKTEVLRTLRDVIDTVSKYAGGALPENARILVRRHLTSLPQRFRIATQNDPSTSPSLGPAFSTAPGGEQQEQGEKEMREGAQRALLLAKEGLDMMAQVSGVLDGTIISAEEWCERLGRKRREERQALGTGAAPDAAAAAPSPAPLTGVGIDGDVSLT